VEKLGDFVRRIRLERKYQITFVAKACGVSQQYVCDVEHGRRGQKMEASLAARLAACLDVPVHDIISRLDKLSEKEMQAYSAYYRVLRSSVRATRVFNLMRTLKDHAARVRIARMSGREADKALQAFEITLNELDKTLTYQGPRPKRWARSGGDDDKFRATKM
jgi:transcriptional regulator with XRE-family HTH domain